MASKAITKRIKAIQKRLGVEDDGILGPITLSRIEALLPPLFGSEAKTTDHSLVTSINGLGQILQYEISSNAYYKRRLSHPIWPGAVSGVTIGVGYDLGFTAKSQIQKDWKGRVSDVDLEKLLKVAGLTKGAAVNALPSVKDVTVSLEAAKEVFYTSTLPIYAKRTRKAYPGIEKLPPDAQSALLSLVFNRGASKSGGRRKEMKAIGPLVAAKDLKGIADQIRLMKRLWDKSKLPGLHKRRDKEAKMVENAKDNIGPSQLVHV